MIFRKVSVKMTIINREFTTIFYCLISLKGFFLLFLNFFSIFFEKICNLKKRDYLCNAF